MSSPFELPLFPLNTVLFPGAPLPLHIFEPRYKRMINRCLEGDRLFGVVLIRHGQEALGPLAEPHEIGCSAQITRVERLEQGRMNILSIGKERFRILSVDTQSQPYLVGRVEIAPIQHAESQITQARADYLYPLVERYIHRMVQAGRVEFEIAQLPNQPQVLAYLAAAILNISPNHKQALLDLDRLDALLVGLSDHYRRELSLLETLLSNSDSRMQGPFSVS